MDDERLKAIRARAENGTRSCHDMGTWCLADLRELLKAFDESERARREVEEKAVFWAGVAGTRAGDEAEAQEREQDLRSIVLAIHDTRSDNPRLSEIKVHLDSGSVWLLDQVVTVLRRHRKQDEARRLEAERKAGG